MQKLINGLHKFRSEVFCSKEDLFLRLAKGQQPDALFITCSDSRVNPNLITQTEPGDLFILRNAGNIVPPYSYGSSEAGTIEFAVAGLGVKHIIVCGHTLCGAMKGLLDPRLVENTPAVKSWLDYAESTRRLIRENYGHLTGTDLLNATIEENVLAQVECIRTHPSVRARLARGEICIYAWVYKMETGEVFQYESSRGQFLPITDNDPSSGLVAGAIAYQKAV